MLAHTLLQCSLPSVNPDGTGSPTQRSEVTSECQALCDLALEKPLDSSSLSLVKYWLCVSGHEARGWHSQSFQVFGYEAFSFRFLIVLLQF